MHVFCRLFLLQQAMLELMPGWCSGMNSEQVWGGGGGGGGGESITGGGGGWGWGGGVGEETYLGGGCSGHWSNKQGVAHSMLSHALPDSGPVPAV